MLVERHTGQPPKRYRRAGMVGRALSAFLGCCGHMMSRALPMSSTQCSAEDEPSRCSMSPGVMSKDLIRYDAAPHLAFAFECRTPCFNCVTEPSGTIAGTRSENLPGPRTGRSPCDATRMLHRHPCWRKPWPPWRK